MQLSAPEIRVLASLIEKEAAVPDSYPLTQSALRLACNQATNRRPVVAYDDRTVEAALMTLKSVGLVRFVHPAQGGRTTRYRHTVGERWRLSTGEALALSALALRGPQTGTEVRARIERLLPTSERGSIDVMLDTLAARSPEPLVARLERRPGERDVRWVATFGEPFDAAALDRLAAAELDDSTADLPRPRTVADGFRFDVPAASNERPSPPLSPGPAPAPAPDPVVASPTSAAPRTDELAALATRVEELGAVIGAVAARLERLERDLGVRDELGRGRRRGSNGAADRCGSNGVMGFRLGSMMGRAVLVDGDGVFDLERVSGGQLGPDARTAISTTALLHDVAATLAGQEPDRLVADAVFGPPIADPPNVFGIGVNYRDHVAETGSALPAAPLVFAKFTGCLTGPTGDIVIASDSTDYEAELVVVIGAAARNVPAEQAWDVIAGVTVGQDVSDRDLQRAGERPQFSLGKSHDTYGPTGPYIVSPDLLADREALAIRCAVNDEVRQDDTTANLIFTVPALIAYLSAMLTLQPGDLIFTGTPSGVGLPTRNFLKQGDIVRTTIDGVGELVNRCV